ncbi:MAG TPA: amino acid adenylation domain-containing protein, partial [Streptosporangiaceae bacterium]|nr:amino acid adenylation domain-containing protein [Streptosporangiaceae bacterium]
MLTDAQRAALTARLRRGRDVSPAGIPRRDPGAAGLPLSFGQEQLWFIDRFAPGQGMYNIPVAISVRGDVATSALDRAVEALVARHEALRTRLVTGTGGRPVQVIDPPGPVLVRAVDLSATAADHDSDAGGRLREFIDSEAVKPFDLAAGPLLRVSLIKLAKGEYLLLVVLHHVIFDGWSAGILLRDLAALYRHEASGEPSGLDELTVQFADYALWERERLRGQEPAELERYWREVMDGFETVPFPADRPRPVVEDWAGGLAVRTCAAGLAEGLAELGRTRGATLFVTLLAGMTALLHRYTGQDDLVVGTVAANRGRPELAPLIGFCVNTLPIRVEASGDPAFTELIDQVKQATIGAYAHQDLPFGRLVDVLQVTRDPGRAPVFQIALAQLERDFDAIEAAGARFGLSDQVTGINAAKFDLSFTAEARPDGLWIECSYKTALFDHETIERFLAHLEVLLHGAVADPAARLSQLPVLTDAERRRELDDWNATARDYPMACLHEAFEAQARRTPSAIAAEFEDEQVSYAELDRRASEVGRLLSEQDVGPEVLVGVCMQASLVRLAALLGILKAGGGYVPLDPALPGDRLAYMIADTGMTVILTDKLSAADLPDAAGVTVLTLAETDLSDPAAAARPAASQVTPANVAYVIYTSGSTGQPKGVVIEHRQAANFAWSMIEPWRIGPDDVVLQFAAYTFDVSVMDMFVPLLAGAKVVLGHADTLHSPRRLAGLMRDSGVTFACLPPAVLNLLTGYEFPALRTLLAAGEELPSELATRWVRPGLTFVNAYGPTETAVIATYGEVTAATKLPPPIGLPSANYQAYVLDSALHPVPVGVTGELHIGGAGVARGYLNRPDLTQARFIPDPFRPGGRLYKTGDLVRRRPDGAIVYLGRTDHQVKVRGLRIELGEIETALAALPVVAQVVATVTTSPAGDKQLVAYLRPAPGQRVPAPADLRAHLATVLPAYMVPAQFVVLADFPLNSSGKINRAALPAPDVAGREPDTAPSPASPLETKLAGSFSTVLQREGVGPADDFFDLGGNSLQVMQLLDLMTEYVDAPLSPAIVFLHPTARRLAAHLGSASAAAAGPLTPLSADTSRPPLILIHAIGGTITDYAPLAAALADRYSPLGLQAPGLTKQGSTPSSLADLVRDYLTMIRTAFPQGPYRLAGWSMGGVIAYELARRLQADNAEVDLLALLDAPFAV